MKGTHERGVTFGVRGRELELSPVFDDVSVSECQSTWCTYDAAIDKVREEVNGNNLCQLRSSSTAAIPHAAAQQYTDVIIIKRTLA